MTEKSVDSEQELLDFRVDKKESEPERAEVLAEKSVNINSADIATLCLLPGIGEKTARKIIDFRNSKGKFESVEDIKRIKGIGDKKFEMLVKFIFVE